MSETFKTELAAFLRDIKAVCQSNSNSCESCPLYESTDSVCAISPLSIAFNPEAAIAAVEAYRKRKKPCAEVIDRALDVYTIEVQKVSKHPGCNVGEYITIRDVMEHFKMFGYTITGFKAQRFVLESHREDTE